MTKAEVVAPKSVSQKGCVVNRKRGENRLLERRAHETLRLLSAAVSFITILSEYRESGVLLVFLNYCSLGQLASSSDCR